MSASKPADVCLILEGTYPYVAGGVSSWVHDLLRAQSGLTFHLWLFLAPDADRTRRYAVPENVVGITEVEVQKVSRGRRFIPGGKRLMRELEAPLSAFLGGGGLPELIRVMDLMEPFRGTVGRRLLMNSKRAWALLLAMYRADHGESPFIDYFWTWRALLGGLWSVLLSEVPPARVYHSISTGYAGLALVKARRETGRPGFLTEHGIYTNERRIEVTMADWLFEEKSLESLTIHKKHLDLRDMWIGAFVGFSRAAYAVSEEIITLFEGNQPLQIRDGADPARLRVIPNGIDLDRFAGIERSPDHPPTVALIGRVVPIKDIKTFIRAVGLLRNSVPNLRAWVCGPTEEDPDYDAECREMADNLDLGKTLEFTGSIRLEDRVGEIDVMALTSISEAQPLVILEFGSAGIPSVATDVGACREMILGASREDPPLGVGGAVVGISNPEETAEALAELLTDTAYYRRCSETIKTRVAAYYDKRDLDRTYGALYAKALDLPDRSLTEGEA